MLSFSELVHSMFYNPPAVAIDLPTGPDVLKTFLVIGTYVICLLPAKHNKPISA